MLMVPLPDPGAPMMRVLVGPALEKARDSRAAALAAHNKRAGLVSSVIAV